MNASHPISIQQIIEPDEHLIQTMAHWMYQWWGKAEDYSLEMIRVYLEHSLQKSRLPQTYAMFDRQTLIGMYQFRLDDLFVRPDIYPWLANVYIDENYRKQGLGRMLLESVAQNARSLPFKEIYLFTKHTNFYEKLGWEYISEIDTFLPECRMQRLYRLLLK